MRAIVVERLEEKENTQTIRTLISQNEISKEKEFWTAESRLLDSLGTISRDLGRELSLNEFLSALAPEFRALHYSPLIPDAQQFRELIVQTHKPIHSEFSILHQQSATKWAPRNSLTDNTCINLATMFSEKRIKELRVAMEQFGRYGFLRNFRVSQFTLTSDSSLDDLKYVEIAPLCGDDAAVEILKTRTAIILKPETPPAILWLSIRDTIIRLERMQYSLESIVGLINLAYLFTIILGGRYHTDPNSTWHDVVDNVRKSLRATDSDLDLPENLKLVVHGSNIFDASIYWRDWFKRDDHPF